MPKKPLDLVDEQAFLQLLLSRYDSITDREFAAELLEFRDKWADPLKPKKYMKASSIKRGVAKDLDKIYSNLESNMGEDSAGIASISHNNTSHALESHSDISAPVWSQLPTKITAPIVSIKKIIKTRDEGGNVIKISPLREIAKLKAKHQRFYTSKISEALILGEGEEFVMRKLREDGEIFDNLKQNQVRALVRTTISNTSHEARYNTEDTTFDSVITGYMWVSVLDLRTTFACASRNGKINKRRSDFDGLPALHWGCRSLCIGITDLTDTTKVERRWAVHDEKITGTRDGQLKTKFTVPKGKENSGDKILKNPKQDGKKSVFDSWFKDLDPARQATWLGPQRYKMYKTGKLSTGDLVRGDGKKKTIKELAKDLKLSNKFMNDININRHKTIKPKITRNAQKIMDERKDSL